MLRYKLKPIQRQVYDQIKLSREKIYVVNCTRRGGKTFTMATIATEIALQAPNAQVHFAAPFQNQVKDYLLPIFTELLSDCPEDLRPQWKPVEGKWVFKNKSFIKLCGVNNRQFDNLRGNKSDFFILDEARDMDELETVVSSIALPQLLSSKFAAKKIILASTPPATPDHPFKKYAEAALARNAYSEYTIDQCWYSKEEIAEIIAAQKIVSPNDKTVVEREFYCKFSVDSTLQIVPEWENHPEYIREVPKDDYFQFFFPLEGMDVGYRDFTAWIMGYYNFQTAGLVIEHEVALRENECTTDRLAELISKAEKEYTDFGINPKSFKRIADNNNLNILADLSRLHKMPFIPVNKKNGKEWMVNQLRQFVSQGKLTIHPRCKMLKASLDFGIWKRDRSEFDRSKELGHYDFIDALVYLVAVLVPTIVNVNPIPPLYKLNVTNMMFPNGMPDAHPNPADDVIRRMIPNPFKR